MVAVVFGLAPHLLRLTFPPAIAEPGGQTLRVLALGQGAFALYGIATTILSSLHRERWTMGLNAASTAVLVGTSFLLVPGTATGAPIAERAALATSIALCCALLAGGLAVRHVAGALISPLTVVRVAAAFAAVAAVAHVLPVHGKVMTVVAALALGVVYLIALVATRELGGSDVAVIARVLGRAKR
jgi:stage V sporulation protein B